MRQIRHPLASASSVRASRQDYTCKANQNPPDLGKRQIHTILQPQG
jgi:hypothetical protein